MICRFFRAGGGPFQVGGIFTVLADHYQILTGGGQHHKFVRKTAADSAGIRLHRPEGDAATGKNLLIGLIHFAIGRISPGLVGIETVAVLHDKLPTSHQAKTGPNFIAKLGLNLIKVERQAAI